MKISVSEAGLSGVPAPILVLPLFKEQDLPAPAAEVDRATGGAIRRVLGAGDFRGRRDEILVLYPTAGVAAERLVLAGLGPPDQFNAERLRRAAGAAVRAAQRLGARGLAVWPRTASGRGRDEVDARTAAQAIVEGAVLAAWDFRELKTVVEEDAPRAEIESVLVVASGENPRALRDGAEYGSICARAENLARGLAARPGNVATPTYLAGVAHELAADHGLDATVLDREAIRREGMGALLAVAQGADEEPRFIALEYRGGASDAPPLVLIGKGVTFDSGGISIKPSQSMEDMKYDMSGAAAVLATMRAVAELRIPANVVGLVPATENLPSGRALKPGDVIRSHLGKTIEVVNTDAEGRLILADALSYARRFKPQAVLDAATLTGACVIALGHHAMGLMGNDDDLLAEVQRAASSSGERCWLLPLWDEYREQLDSEVADLKNTGGRPAGTITAGWFLKEFAGEFRWAHLDIAGTAYREDVPPYLRKGATGVPTRLFIEWIRSRSAG